jgi:hypothetical protein
MAFPGRRVKTFDVEILLKHGMCQGAESIDRCAIPQEICPNRPDTIARSRRATQIGLCRHKKHGEWTSQPVASLKLLDSALAHQSSFSRRIG